MNTGADKAMATIAVINESRRPKILVVNTEELSLFEGYMEKKGSWQTPKIVTIAKVKLVPMFTGNTLRKNITVISSMKAYDAHAAEAFAKTQFVVPAEFFGKNVYFCGSRLNGPFSDENVAVMHWLGDTFVCQPADIDGLTPINSFAAIYEE